MVPEMPVALVADGLTERQIAERLNLAEKTIKNYVTSVLSKLEMARRTEAAVEPPGICGPTAPTEPCRVGTFDPVTSARRVRRLTHADRRCRVEGAHPRGVLGHAGHR
jgi:hypothetical protein